MRIRFLLFFLTIQSSYFNNKEVDATEDTFDTIQFLATNSGTWRIRTYATDQDVHVWSISSTFDNIIELARQNTRKHYGDVLFEGYIIETTEGIDGLRYKLRDKGLSNYLETSESGFFFWVPEDTNYRTRSTPH